MRKLKHLSSRRSRGGVDCLGALGDTRRTTGGRARAGHLGLAEQSPAADGLQRPVRRSSSCSIPIVDGKDSEEYPWVSGLPEPERARGHEPAGKAENGEKTLKPLLGETRVTWRTLDCLKSKPIRSMEGLWLQRLTARWPLRQDKRTACATAESPAPRNECG